MSIITKRQQARNERSLQELIKTVPGNEKCADCGAWSPGWASWSLGIFLCVRCASLHRKLGTHISKVKSLSMDSWSNDQVENMRKNGNVKSNRLFNPQNVKPPMPADMDEADSTMERFLRRKYDSKTLQGNRLQPPTVHSTGSSSSEEPPPLPPKPAYPIGTLSRGSSTLSTPQIPSQSSQTGSRVTSPISSYSFDNIAGPTGESFESKMATLKAMGFTDSRKNATVLKGQDGNLQRSIDSLIRLSGGSNPPSRSRTPAPTRPDEQKELPRPNEVPSRSPAPVSTNPFDKSYGQPQQLPPTPDTAGQFPSLPQNQQPPQVYTNPSTYNSNNPFGLMPTTASPSLDQSFGGLTLSQPLFPHATGGLPQHNPIQTPYQPILTPPLPSVNSHFATPVTNMYSPAQVGNQNPFLSHMSSQPPASQPQALNPPNRYLSTTQQNLNNFQSNVSQSQPYSHNQGISQTTPSNIVAEPASLPLQPTAQPAARPDKSAILALYNYPQLAPTPKVIGTDADKEPIPDPTNRQAAQVRSASMPMPTPAGTRNPFAIGTSGTRTMTEIGGVAGSSNRHISQESVDVNGFASGRTSPDAFANLSARYVR